MVAPFALAKLRKVRNDGMLLARFSPINALIANFMFLFLQSPLTLVSRIHFLLHRLLLVRIKLDRIALFLQFWCGRIEDLLQSTLSIALRDFPGIGHVLLVLRRVIVIVVVVLRRIVHLLLRPENEELCIFSKFLCSLLINCPCRIQCQLQKKTDVVLAQVVAVNALLLQDFFVDLYDENKNELIHSFLPQTLCRHCPQPAPRRSP